MCMYMCRSLLNFLHPGIFNSSDDFEKWFATPFAGMGVNQREMEVTEEEKLLVINRLHSMLRPFVLRREKREVETQLAAKIERVLRTRLSGMQQLAYRAILEGHVSVHNRMMQLRKVCNHPYLFHPYPRGMAGSYDYMVDEDVIRACGKFQLLDQMLPKLQVTGHRVLIFNQMTKVSASERGRGRRRRRGGGGAGVGAEEEEEEKEEEEQE